METPPPQAPTPPPPARLIGYFAHDAPICVIARRGPTRYTRLIVWETDKDVFHPGQWFRGKIEHATLSDKGTHMAVGLMGAKIRTDHPGKEQKWLICRPPYTIPLEIWGGNLSAAPLMFLPGDIISTPTIGLKKLASNKCIFVRKAEAEGNKDHEYIIDARAETAEGFDQQGRAVIFEEGCVYVMVGEEKKLLLDTNPMKLASFEAPPWACNW